MNIEMKDKSLSTKVKVDLISAKLGEIEIIGGANEGKFTFSDFSLSVYTIPILEVVFQIEDFSSKLMKLEKDDKIFLSFSIDNGQNFFTKFGGEITTQEVSLNEDKTHTLKVNAQSPFMRLQDTLVNQDLISDCKGLRQTLRRIIEAGEIWGELIIDEDVDDNIDIGFVYEYPALSLMKQIFLQRDLVYNFDEGSKLIISNGRTAHRRAMENMKTISTNDMISMKFNK